MLPERGVYRKQNNTGEGACRFFSPPPRMARSREGVFGGLLTAAAAGHFRSTTRSRVTTDDEEVTFLSCCACLSVRITKKLPTNFDEFLLRLDVRLSTTDQILVLVTIWSIWIMLRIWESLKECLLLRRGLDPGSWGSCHPENM